jgi:2-oxo-4-hydroxy-4-carboxy-5-ureidoimidazoline decarboxylase
LRLDKVDERDFIAAMTPLFEGAPRFLARLASARPYGSADTMFERAATIALSMPEDEQIELVDAHPRLGAPPESVSRESFREQGYDRPNVAGAHLAGELERLNDEYERRFGFRYCVFVAGRSREALLPELRGSLANQRTTELRRALRAVVDIARDRYANGAFEERA